MSKSGLSLLRTSAFRTAAVSALFYAVLTGAIVGIVYPLVAGQIHAQIRAGLQAESSALAALYQVRGSAALERVIHNRSANVLPRGDNDDDDPGRRYYALSSGGGRVLAGDLARWPPHLPSRGWAEFHFHGRQVQGFVTALPNGDRLLVGQSLAITETLAEQSELVIGFGALLALLAGLAGGAAVGALVMRRIREASATAERIQAGHLGERLTRGGPSEHDALARAFNNMLERIERAVLGLREIATRTAHEMRHPLTRMDQALARAEHAASPQETAWEIGKARQEIEELARRTEALLRLARLETDHERRDLFRELDLAALVADVAGLYAPSAEDHGHRLRIDTPATLACVGDRQLLAQALANLLDNAVQYARRDAEIAVELRAAGDAAVMMVTNAADDGAAGATTVSSGAGLGLPIARAIAQLHQGSLEVERSDGLFRARLTLPLPRRTAKRGGGPAADSVSAET